MIHYCKSLVLTLFFIGCSVPGTLNEPCKSDGTCNSPHLTCNQRGYCMPPIAAPPDRRCYYESDCFCVTCSEKCSSSGVKLCAYSDTSVWGSKPSICECKLLCLIMVKLAAEEILVVVGFMSFCLGQTDGAIVVDLHQITLSLCELRFG